MAENSRKRCRKSKLVPRDCVDLVEDDPDLQAPAHKKLLLEKIKKEPEDYIRHSYCPATHKFSVEVEVEDMDNSAPDEDAPDYMKYLFSLSKESQETEPTQNLEFADNSLLLEQKLVIPVTEEEKNCNIDVKKLQKMLAILHKKYPKEKEVVMHCRNQWGRAFHERCPTELKKGPQEMLLHDVLARWKQWTIVTRARESPYCYKCYICDCGWWTYTEFATHVTQHPHCKFQMQTRNLECDIVAYEGDSPGVTDVDIHGKCTKCAKTYDHHMTNKRSTDAYYYCNYCDERFQTCRTLTKHEGTCPRNPIRVLAISKAGKEYSFSDFSCQVCKTVFLSKPDLEEHMVICHNVRSDEPIITINKTCKECDQNYYNFFSHVCLKKNYITECQHCFRKFQNKQMLEHHLKIWDKIAHCRICDKYLVKCCMAAEHYALHSAEFILAHRCLVCRKIKVFASEEVLKSHVNRYHKRFDARRPKTDRIIMPRIMLQQCMVDQVKKGAPKSAQKAASARAAPGAKLPPQVRVYVPVHSKKSTVSSNEESQPKNTTTAHDDTVSMRSEVPPQETTTEVPSQETPAEVPSQETTTEMPLQETSTEVPLQETSTEVPSHETTTEVPSQETSTEVAFQETLVRIKQEKEDVPEKVKETTTVPEITVNKIKIEKDINEEKTSEVGSSVKNQEVKEKDRNIDNIMAELTEFLDIKPDIVKEEKVSDDEATLATQKLTNLLQMSNTESDIAKVFVASTTFAANFQAEEVTNNSEHSSVFQLSKSILEATIKQEKEPQVLINESSVTEDPIAESPNNSSKQSLSETSDLSSLNLEPEIILRAGYRKRKIYRCNKCDFTGFHREYKEHINSHCDKKAINKEFKADITYKCTKCDKVFITLKRYALHFDKHGYQYMSCPQCSQQFESVTKLMPHLNNHLKGQFFKLQLINSCEDNSKKVYQCKNCAEIVESEKWFEHWEKHLELKKPEEKVSLDTVKVGEKGERSLNPGSLKEVLVILTKQFTNESRHAKSCCVCARVFERKNDTKRHLIEHLLEDAYANIPTNQMLKCQICSELHKKADGYKKHMRDHANLPIYKCGLCNKTFSDSSNFTKHKKIHNLKAYICDICSKKFQAKVSLEKHIQMHMQTEPITCAECNRVFHDRSFYRRHYRQLHDKIITKYRCMLCREKFASCREKWDHMWDVHKQRKEEADCPICGVSYRKFIDVKKHAYEKHGKSITLSSLWSLLSKVKRQEKEEKEGLEGVSKGVVKEEVSSDDDCLLIEEEPETLVVYD